MAAIYLAFQRGHAGFQKLVVLKQILPDVKAEQELVDMFLDEAKITAAFNHPNIAHVYDLDVASEELFLAMEFIAGADLLEIARACHESQEPIPIGFTMAVVHETAMALHYAHTFTDPLGRPHPVIHRDVAEKNIMVTYDGTTKLLDFGIAKAKDRNTRTAAGMVKGTLGYMSPEQLRGKDLDARTDVYSLGVVFHECLTGMRLFHGEDHEAEIMAALETDAAPPSEQNPNVAPEIDSVVLKALRRNRDERFPNALEMARAIERISAERMWHQEQIGQLVQRYFADRREQTRQLLSSDALAASHETTRHVLPPAPPPSPARQEPRAEPRSPRRNTGERERERAERASAQAQRGGSSGAGVARPVLPKGAAAEALKAQLAEIAAGISDSELEQLNIAGSLPVIPPAKADGGSGAGWSGVPSTRPAQKAVEDVDDSGESMDDATNDLRAGLISRPPQPQRPPEPKFDDSTVVRGPPAPPPKRRPDMRDSREARGEMRDSREARGDLRAERVDRNERSDRGGPRQGQAPIPRRTQDAPRRKRDQDSAFSMFKLGAAVFAILAAAGLLLVLAMRVLGSR
ncbi:MAG TPA: protein kinase [Myxococcaceae bacterium]|nr:protein kinase [Myxococcaceae bacterium]